MRFDEAIHQHAVTVFQSLGHDPLAQRPAVQFHRARLQLVFGVDHKHHLAKRAVNHRALRHAQTVGPVGAAQRDAHKLPGAQAAVGVGDFSPHIKATGLRVDPFTGEVELARTRVGAAIGQLHIHSKPQAAVGGALARHAQLAGSDLLGHAQQVAFGHAEVHVHRVGLHDGGQQAVTRRDQAALRLGGDARGAADGRWHPGVAQVQAGLVGLGLGLLQGGLGRFSG